MGFLMIDFNIMLRFPLSSSNGQCWPEVDPPLSRAQLILGRLSTWRSCSRLRGRGWATLWGWFFQFLQSDEPHCHSSVERKEETEVARSVTLKEAEETSEKGKKHSANQREKDRGLSSPSLGINLRFAFSVYKHVRRYINLFAFVLFPFLDS